MPGPVANVKANHEMRMQRIEELSKMSEYAMDGVNEADLDKAISNLPFGSPYKLSPASPGFILAMKEIRSDALAKAAKIKSEALAKAAKATAAEESARIDRELTAAVERARIEREKPSMPSNPKDRAATIKQERAAFAIKSAATKAENDKRFEQFKKETNSAVARVRALAQNATAAAETLKHRLNVKREVNGTARKKNLGGDKRAKLNKRVPCLGQNNIYILINIYIMLQGFVRQHLVSTAIVVYLCVYGLILTYQPSFLYNADGSLREFGVGFRRKTVIPVWLLAIFCAILSYFFVMVYTTT